jgi:hypothetical protein
MNSVKSISIITAMFLLAGCNLHDHEPALTILKQGWFSAGGKVTHEKGTLDDVYKTDGQSIHYDHAVAFFQIPPHARKTSAVFLHGNTQTGRCWSTTPDGREGFAEIFLRKGFSTYLIDQPRRGNASRNAKEVSVAPMPVEQMYFDQFRLGRWPRFYEGVSFPKDSASLDQFYRQMTPDVGKQDMDVIVDGVSAVLEKSGDAVLFTHSAGGVYGWFAGIRSSLVKAIVAIEPGAFPFPAGDAPEPIQSKYLTLRGISAKPMEIPAEQFEKLTKIPIVIYFGDNIPEKHSDHPSSDYWYATREMAFEFAKRINARGGHCTVVSLPEEGIKGNTHFIMSDTNNRSVAEHISRWLEKNGF